MVIPRLLSRGTSPAAQRNHFAAILAAAPELPAVIYNSPYYGFETKAELFFELRSEYPNLVGFKEFGGAESLSYAAEHITSVDEDVLLMVGVDTQVFHGYIHCGAVGAITGIGNCLPGEVLHLLSLCALGAGGDEQARTFASELENSLAVLSSYDEGPDLVLYYKYLLTLLGESDFELNFNEDDSLDDSQKQDAEGELKRFQDWWDSWAGSSYGRD
jgi:4-hydroxy-tetrahydrodipicolinate synthase